MRHMLGEKLAGQGEGATKRSPAAVPGAEAIRAGDRTALARAITAIENGLAGARPLLHALASDVGRAHVIGVTGVPGAGKSTLINAMVRELTARGGRVAVVAVDPSSPITGGAVLGDRTRMNDASAAESVFIRSLASRGNPGGVSHATQQVVDLFDAAGFDPIIVETVGAGQSEVAIADLVDSSVVVCAPGLGDSVQALKAGILEIADALVVNKGDLPHAERVVRELKEMLHLRARRAGWQVPVLSTTATTGEGIAALVDKLSAHARESGRGRRLRRSLLAARSSTRTRSTNPPAHYAEQLVGRDPYVRYNRIELVEVSDGTATLSMRVDREHMNFNGSCHGGAIFTLADSAFGLASNSRGSVVAGIDAHITYQVAVREGDVLTARATEVSRSPKLAVYRVEVTREDGTAVSSFTGTVFVTKRTHPEAAGAA